MTEERLDRLERIVESLANTASHIMDAQETQQESIQRLGESIQRLTDGQLGLQTQMGLISEAVLDLRQMTRELKAGQERQERILDYLVGRDGDRQTGTH